MPVLRGRSLVAGRGLSALRRGARPLGHAHTRWRARVAAAADADSEPYVRRFWPEALVSWSRLLAGRLRDPLVGRDILFGSLAGGASLVLATPLILGPGWLGLAPRASSAPSLFTLLGGPHLVGWLFAALMPITIPLVVALYGFHSALAGQPLFKDEILPG